MKLLQDWKQAWKWFSMQAMAIVIVMLAAWAAMPDDLKDALPHWVVALIAATVLLLGIAGRLVDQSKPNA